VIKKDFLKYLAEQATDRAASDYRLAPVSDLFFYPYADTKANTTFPSIACVFKLEGLHRHFVVMAIHHNADLNERHYSMWCGDKTFSGARNFDEVKRLLTSSAFLIMPAGVGLTPKRHDALAQEAATRLQQCTEMLDLSNPDGCNFWQLHVRGTVCRHVGLVMHHLTSNSRELNQLLLSMEEALDNLLDSATLPGDAVAPIVQSRAQGTELSRWLFRVPVLIEGPHGTGKTTGVRMFAKAEGHHLVEIGGHAGLEAIDLLGHLIPIGGAEKSFVWKDGPLSEAFRRASKGEKVIFLIDELLRIPQRELAILLTALSPFEGEYFLRTGRVVSVEDGVAQEETLRAPIANLAVVATTNVNHFVEECDPALRERFMVTYKDMTEAELLPILVATAKARGMDEGVVTPLMKFFKIGRKAQVEGVLFEGPSARTLCRALEHAQSEDEIQDWLQDQALLWVSRNLDGSPNKEQLDQCRNLIKKCFSVT